MRARARNVIRRYLDGLLVLAPRDADQASIVVVARQAFAITREPIQQFADLGRNPTLVRQTR